MYSSSDENVATVDSEGKVVTTGKGTATIQAVSVSNGEIVGTLEVTVVLPVKQPSSLKARLAKGTKVVLQWKKAAEATKYEVYRASTKKGTYKKITTITSSKKQITYQDKKVKAKKKYYYKIRGYQVVDGEKIYGNYSKIVNILVKAKK